MQCQVSAIEQSLLLHMLGLWPTAKPETLSFFFSVSQVGGTGEGAGGAPNKEAGPPKFLHHFDR